MPRAAVAPIARHDLRRHGGRWPTCGLRPATLRPAVYDLWPSTYW